MALVEGLFELGFDLGIGHAHGMQGGVGEEGQAEGLPLTEGSPFLIYHFDK